MTRRAVVLFNLGGPDSPEAVQPFLRNLFSDPAILGLPAPLRALLARLIARRRAPHARQIYARIGGRSPLLELTRFQAEALAEVLNDGSRVFIAMRYWHPLTEQAVAEVKEWRPDEVVLLPLYPQYSATTSGSSLAAWHKAAQAAGLDVPTATICCYPTDPGFVAAVARLTRDAVAASEPNVRVLFSAHGLPKKVIAGGDPYQWQVEQSAAAVVAAMALPHLDWRVTYQSRVGPMEWIGPYTDDEIRRAGTEGKSLVVVPIAFVSEHSETLVELDMEYRELADHAGVPGYRRVPAVGTDSDFIGGLARLVQQARPGLNPPGGRRLCPAPCGRCPISQG